MFASVGVEVNRLTKSPSHRPAETCGPAIVLRITTGVRLRASSKALAYALPYASGGTAITVYWDRVQSSPGANLYVADVILTKVLVHEITHILQGVARHSDSGVMRGNWNSQGYYQMRQGPLPFTAHDVALLQAGLEARTAASPEALSGKLRRESPPRA